MNIRDIAYFTNLNEKQAKAFLDECDPLFSLLVKLHKENQFLKQTLHANYHNQSLEAPASSLQFPSSSLEIHPELNSITVQSTVTAND